MRTLPLMSALVLLAASTLAQAQSSTSTSTDTEVQAPAARQPINREQRAQQRRIQAGLESGALTAREAAALEKGEARIDAAQQRAKADGTVTAKERKHLVAMTGRESEAIYRQKHDRQRAHRGGDKN